jgi:hypothetical protein
MRNFAFLQSFIAMVFLIGACLVAWQNAGTYFAPAGETALVATAFALVWALVTAAILMTIAMKLQPASVGEESMGEVDTSFLAPAVSMLLLGAAFVYRYWATLWSDRLLEVAVTALLAGLVTLAVLNGKVNAWLGMTEPAKAV